MFLFYFVYFLFFFQNKNKVPYNWQFCMFFSNILHQNDGNCFNIICYNAALYHSENRKTSSTNVYVSVKKIILSHNIQNVYKVIIQDLFW